jgi:outer membrane autotransporter protein
VRQQHESNSINFNYGKYSRIKNEILIKACGQKAKKGIYTKIRTTPFALNILALAVIYVISPSSARGDSAQEFTKNLVGQYDLLRQKNPNLQQQNLDMVKKIMADASIDRRNLAISDNTNYAMSSMMDRARGRLNLGGLWSINGENANPFMNLGDASPGKLHEYGKSISNSVRPCAPALSDHVTPLFSCSTSSSYPSGHTAKATGASLLTAYLFPERYQSFIVRGQEYGESRIVAGQHYTLDVMASRAMTYKAVADLLAIQAPDPNSWLNQNANAANIRQIAIDSCGGLSLAACSQLSSSDDLYDNYEKQKAFYNFTKYYYWLPVGPNDKPMEAPENSNYLISTRFPYLTKEQLLDVIRTTADPSGQVLDDPWSRINLFAAADGYGSFDKDVQVSMDASLAKNELLPGAGYFASDTWRNNISGSGSLTKEGTGTLALTGSNTFAGFHLNEGELKLYGTNHLTGDVLAERGLLSIIGGDLTTTKDLVVASTAALTLEGAKLSADKKLDIQGSTNLSGSAVIDVNSAGTGTISGQISGAGGLVKTGAGRLDLTHNNTYTGNTLVKAGTLGLGSSTSAGSGSIELADGSTLAYADGIKVDNSLLINGVVSLQVDTGQAVQAGAIGGGGTFKLVGNGRLDIQGDLSDFSGLTQISQGTVTANSALGGTVNVDQGGTLIANGPTTAHISVGSLGTLKGSGSVGTTQIDNGGTVAPGNSPGTLRVLGDITFAQGSTYEFEVDPASGAHDLISVSGSAQLQGGTVAHVGLAGQYAPFGTYTILTASDGVTGKFENATSLYTFLTPQLSYDANNVMLTLMRNDVRFASVASDGNQVAVAGALDRAFSDPITSTSSSIYSSLVTYNPEQARAALDDLAGEFYASLQTAKIENTQSIREAALDQLRDTDYLKQTGIRGWIRPYHTEDTYGGSDKKYEINSNMNGVLAGVDFGVGIDTRAGAYVGTSHESTNAIHKSNSASSNNTYFGVYGGHQAGPVSVRGGFGYSWMDSDSRRTIRLPGIDENVRAQFRGETAQIFGEVGYQLKAGRYMAEPFVSFAFVNLKTHSFEEKGGEAALLGGAESLNASFSTIGLRNRFNAPFEQVWLHPELDVGLRHTLSGRNPDKSLAIGSSDNVYNVQGASLATDVGIFRAALTADLTPDASLTLNVSGQLGDQDRTQNQGDLQLRMNF